MRCNVPILVAFVAFSALALSALAAVHLDIRICTCGNLAWWRTIAIFASALACALWRPLRELAPKDGANVSRYGTELRALAYQCLDLSQALLLLPALIFLTC